MLHHLKIASSFLQHMFFDNL